MFLGFCVVDKLLGEFSHVHPRSFSVSGKLLSTDLPCGFTRNWSCPSFPPAVKASLQRRLAVWASIE